MSLLEKVKKAIENLENSCCPICGEKLHTGMNCMSNWCEGKDCKYVELTKQSPGRIDSTYIHVYETKKLLECLLSENMAINDKFQEDLQEMQAVVEVCGIYCGFQPCDHFKKQFDSKRQVLNMLYCLKGDIGTCNCILNIEKYIKKWEDYNE